MKSALEIRPLRTLIDIGKPFQAYRKLLNLIPSRVKYHGVFSSFEKAHVHVPEDVLPGFDHEDTAGTYEKYAEFIRPGDYPVLFWLSRNLQPGARIFDFGGNIGFTLYAFEKYISLSDDIEWLVCDLPAVIKEGERFARERQETRIRFTTSFQEADSSDCFLSSGTLQYVETPLRDLLLSLKNLPRCLLINRIPLHPTGSCVTIQNVGWMASPYHIFHRDKFIEEIASLGYTLVDSWADPGHECWIPFYPEFSITSYSGLYFVLPQHRNEPRRS